MELLVEEMIPRDRGGTSGGILRRVLRALGISRGEGARGAAKRRKHAGLRLRLHADQFSADYGSLLAAELGADTADHLESTGPRGMEALAGGGRDAGAAAGVGVRVGVGALSGGAENDRRRECRWCWRRISIPVPRPRHRCPWCSRWRRRN